MAVNLGEDADTTGAVYGQIAGVYGEHGVPRQWRGRIARGDDIADLATKLYEAAQADARTRR